MGITDNDKKKTRGKDPHSTRTYIKYIHITIVHYQAVIDLVESRYQALNNDPEPDIVKDSTTNYSKGTCFLQYKITLILYYKS